MTNKLKFLTKMSLDKKIKTKWFLFANLIFAFLIIGLLNVDMIIRVFGGEFEEKQEILVVDNGNYYDKFKTYFEGGAKYLDDYIDTEIIKYDGDYDSFVLMEEIDNKILIQIDENAENYIEAKIVSDEVVGSITNTLIISTLNNIRRDIVLSMNNIDSEVYLDINKSVVVDSITLSSSGDNMMVASIMQVITLPVFMLILFLVQMIGAEVNEEKTTRSMEIIISNVSPRTHFISKIISSNLFVLIQGGLLIIYVLLAIGFRYIFTSGNIISGYGLELTDLTSNLSLNGVMDTISLMIPILLVMIILTFIAYSLLAGILASMTTNLEDFQQLQTPIVIISLVGYYLSIMSSIFSGSLFVRMMSYIPFISSLLSPTLYVMGDIGLIDLLISILLLCGVIYLLIKYGLRIYKVGILNYSQTGLWKKMFKAVKEK